MKRFMVVSGFLGAGKTTSMIALAEYIISKYLRKVILDAIAVNIKITPLAIKNDSCIIV